LDHGLKLSLLRHVMVLGNAETFFDIRRRDAVGTLALKPVLPVTKRVKLHYTMEYYFCNSTEKRLQVVTTNSIPCILHTL